MNKSNRKTKKKLYYKKYKGGTLRSNPQSNPLNKTRYNSYKPTDPLTPETPETPEEEYDEEEREYYAEDEGDDEEEEEEQGQAKEAVGELEEREKVQEREVEKRRSKSFYPVMQNTETKCYTDNPIVWTCLDKAISVALNEKCTFLNDFQYYLISREFGTIIYAILNTTIFGYIIDFIFTKLQKLNIIDKKLKDYNIGHKLVIIVAVFLSYIIKYPLSLIKIPLEEDNMIHNISITVLRYLMYNSDMKIFLQSACDIITDTHKRFTRRETWEYCSLLRNIFLFLEDNKLNKIFNELIDEKELWELNVEPDIQGLIEVDILFVIFLNTINLIDMDSILFPTLDKLLSINSKEILLEIVSNITKFINTDNLYSRIFNRMTGEAKYQYCHGAFIVDDEVDIAKLEKKIKSKISKDPESKTPVVVTPQKKPKYSNVSCIPTIIGNAFTEIERKIDENNIVMFSTVANKIAKTFRSVAYNKLNTNVQKTTKTELNKLFKLIRIK